jgi:hypothetical protein
MGGIDRSRALQEGFRYEIHEDSNDISWYYGPTHIVSVSRSEASLLTVDSLINIRIMKKVCEEVRVSVYMNSIYTEEGQFDLHNIRTSSSKSQNPLTEHIEDLYRQQYCWKTKGGEYIPFEELSSFHLANIIGKVPSLIPEGIISEAKKRFSHVVVTVKDAELAGCCKDGIQRFQRRKGVAGDHCSLSFLLDNLSFAPNFMGRVIKYAILKEI